MKETVSVLISAEEIDRRITALAEEIRQDYADKKITLVGTLKGAVMFMVDLARKLEHDVEFDFVNISSYGDDTKSSGSMKLNTGLGMKIEGKHVLIIEDIVDSGHTLVFLREHIAAMNPASLKVCALLDKPSRREAMDATFDYLGFSIPDEFVVGYGLDYAQRYRNLPYLGVLHFE